MSSDGLYGVEKMESTSHFLRQNPLTTWSLINFFSLVVVDCTKTKTYVHTTVKLFYEPHSDTLTVLSNV